MGASERDKQARSAWHERVGRLDLERLVFVDECATNLGLTPLRARAPRGERAIGRAPRNRGKNTTLIASLSPEGMGASMAFEGVTDAFAFETYVEHFLVPALREGEVVVMDNLQVHKSKRVRELIEERGASVLLLPSYSPDLNPIEEAFSKIKCYLRRVEARTREALLEAIGGALSSVSAGDAQGWFAHCGYIFDQSL